MLDVLKDRSFLKKMITIAIPVSMQSLINFGVQMTDTVMVGKFGEVALSATSLSGSFSMIFGCICMGLGCGAAVITAQYWGKKELGPIREMTSICLKATFIASLIFTFLGMAFPETILSIYTSDEAIVAEGAKYLRLLAISFVFNGLATGITQILRTVGSVNIAMAASAGSFVINIICNYMFIFGNWGAPRMEVEGAAVGTIIARVFELVVMGGYLLFVDKKIGFRIRHFRGFSREIMKKYLKAGAPVLVSDLIMILGNSLVAIIIGHIGAEFTAANSISNTVSNAAFSLFFGVASASSVLTGNTIGEGQFKKAFAHGKGFLSMSLIAGVVFGVILYFARWPLIGIYDVSESTALYASQMITVISCIMPFQLVEHTLTKGVLRGGGDTRFLIIGDTVFAYIVAAPLGYLSAFVWGFPVWAVFLLMKSETFCKVALCGWRFFSKRWIKDVTVRGEGLESVNLGADPAIESV